MAEVDIHLRRGNLCECGHLDITHHVRSVRGGKRLYRADCRNVQESTTWLTKRTRCDCQQYIPELDFTINLIGVTDG